MPTGLHKETNQIIQHSVQQNTLYFFRHSLLQHIVNQSNKFRPLMGLSSGIRMQVKFHETEQAMYYIVKTHKKCKKTIRYDVGDFVTDP
jgi:hypothetical protein